MLSDPDRAVIQRYGILNPQDNLAQPTVIILDPAGIVRYAYVGHYSDDRPTAPTILAELEKVVTNTRRGGSA